MKKTLSRATAALLAVCLLFGALPAFSSAAKKNETPVIFIAGFVSTPTVDKETGDRLFPPDRDTIVNALKDAAGDIAKSALKRDWASLDEPLSRALYGMFDPIRCDENGVPYNSATDTSYVWPTADEILAKYDPERGYTSENNIYYSFDWRLDLRTLAAQFADFADYVCSVTGAEKLNVIASSMGACVLSAYIDGFGYARLNKCVFLSGAFQGASVAGDAFAGRFSFDGETLVAFLSAATGRDLKGEVLDALIDILYQQGVVGDVVELAAEINAKAMGPVYAGALSTIFGRIPGFWALIPYDRYDEAKENFIAGRVTDEFYEKIDYFHGVQGRVPGLIQTGIDSGVGISILSKYCTSGIPAVESQTNLTDMVVDTMYSSVGAVTAPINRPFGGDYRQAVDDGKNRLSCDGYIDASTAAFPDYTWFLKNVKHTVHPASQMAFIDALFAFEGQPDVTSFAAYPQFLICTKADDLVPLTPDTDESVTVNPVRGKNAFERFRFILRDWKTVFEKLFALLKETIKMK
ncbi:MAG: hypothetical protein IK104_10605 [Clostridia bacterium]|nr:hypothetical protein [Clostridia bacterium]